MRFSIIFIMLIFCISIESKSTAAPLNNTSTHYNYMMFCQGCHGPSGEGSQGNVPKLQGLVGYFTHNKAGRVYLATVPGVIAPNLSAKETADLLNWLVDNFAQTSRFTSNKTLFKYFTEDEIIKYGRDPIIDTNTTRQSIIRKMRPYIPRDISESLEFNDWFTTNY